jgi:hypothetical protein
MEWKGKALHGKSRKCMALKGNAWNDMTRKYME